MHTTGMRLAGSAIFVLTFALGLLMGWPFWSQYWSLDGELWVSATDELAEGRLIGPEHSAYGYPATTILVPAAALMHAAGWESRYALQATMLVGLALLIAAATVAAYAARPRSYWWLFVGFALLFQTHYWVATPPSGLLMPLAALFAFVTLIAYEKPSLRNYLLVGAAGALMLATRFETGAVLLGTAILLLRFSSGKPLALFATLGASVLGFALLDVFLWQDPYFHMVHMVEKFFMHSEGITASSGHTALPHALQASVIGLATLAGLFVLLVTKTLRALPKTYAWWLSGTTLLMLACLFLAEHHPTWLFYPVLIVPELLAPLVLADAIRAALDRTRFRLPISPPLLAFAFMSVYAAWRIFEYLMRGGIFLPF